MLMNDMSPNLSPEGMLPLLSASETEGIVEQLFAIDAFWLPRHQNLPFFTLGATNYYDLTANHSKPYWKLARQYNPFLLENFAELYARLRTSLEQHMQEPVEYLEHAALPGFQIFAGDPTFSPSHQRHDIMHDTWLGKRDGSAYPGNPIHVDAACLAEARRLAARDGQSTTISFTLPLLLPQHGAGLKIWPLTADDTQGLSTPAQLQLFHSTPARLIEYVPGSLFVHSGAEYHQAHGLPTQAGEMRITLQGHGIRQGQVWQLFW